jgi:hypothetical protein
MILSSIFHDVFLLLSSGQSSSHRCSLPAVSFLTVAMNLSLLDVNFHLNDWVFHHQPTCDLKLHSKSTASAFPFGLGSADGLPALKPSFWLPSSACFG